MISGDVLDAMVASGCTAEQIASVVKAAFASDEEATERRRAKAREIKRAQRASEKAALAVSTGQSWTSQDNAGQGETTEDKVDNGSLSPIPLLSPTPPNNPLTPKPSIKSNSRACRLPDDWVLTGPNLAYALSRGFAEPQIVSMHEAFCAWAWSASGKNAVKRSWDQAWRSWVLREKPNGNARAGPVRATTVYQQKQLLDLEAINGLEDFARRSRGGDGSDFEDSDGHPGARPQGVLSGPSGAVIDLPSRRGEAGG